MTESPTPNRPPRSGSRGVVGKTQWLAMSVILCGSYMSALDTTVLGVALPDIADDLDATEALGIDWVVTSYLISVAVVQPATGWLADRFGKRRVYVASLAAFTIGSGLAGIAPSMELLVAARVLQGLAGGAMQPTGMAMIYELFPADKRGTALGLWGVAIMAAPALGPPLGGWVTASVSWRWIFLVNLPIGLIALLMSRRYLFETGFTDAARRLHRSGWVLAGVGIVALVVTSRQATTWGLTSATTLGGAVLSIVCLTTLVILCLRREDPLIEFRMWAVPTFSTSMAVVALLTATQYARLTFLPVELQVVRGLGPDQVGLMLAPAAIGVAATMPVGGWLTDRIGARTPVAIGMTINACSTWWLGTLQPTTSTGAIVTWLVIGGLGLGLALTPNTVAAMNSLPNRFVAQASAVRSINRQLAGAIGTAAFAALLVNTIGVVSPDDLAGLPLADVQSSYNRIFLISAALQGACVVLAMFLPGRARTRAHQAARSAEWVDPALSEL